MKAVIYARNSSDNQREESIEGQIRECMEYAIQMGILTESTKERLEQLEEQKKSLKQSCTS